MMTKITKIFLAAVLAGGLVSIMQAAEGFVKKPVKRIISISAQKALSLKPGKVQIVLDHKAHKSTRFAAEELAEHLGKVLKCTIPVKRGKADKGMTPVYLGFGKNNAMLDSRKLTRDAFYIVIRDGAVRIAGKDSPTQDSRQCLNGGVWSLMHERATLFGVYDFLERFADCRFYFPGEMGTLLPARKELTLPETFILDRPDWAGRRFNGVFTNSSWYEGRDPRAIKHPGRVMHYYRIRFSTEFPMPVLHGTSRMDLNKRFGKTHPEYFAMQKNGTYSTGTRGVWGASVCYSSGIREEIYKDWVAMLKGDVSSRPGLEKSVMWRAHRNQWVKRGVVDVMPADSFERCYCPKCRIAMTDKEHFATDLVWGYAAEVGRRLKKDGFKNAFVPMSAYFPYQDVPDVELPDNVDVLVCLTGPWDKYNPEKLKKDKALIKAWCKKLGHKVMLANYGYSARGSRSVRGLPDPTPRAHVAYYKSVMPYINGVSDFYDNTDRFMYNHLEDYMFAKLAWDNKVDTDRLFEEYYVRMFGKAAPVMRKILERFEDIWLQKIGGRTVDTPIGPVTSIPSASEIWSNIYNEKTLQVIVRDFNAAEKLVSGDELKRVKFFRREFLDPLTASRQQWKKTFSLPKALIGFASDRDDCLLYLNGLNHDSKLKTTVRCRFVKGEMIVEFDCEEPELGSVATVRRKKGDKECWQDNGVEILFNPSGDLINYFHIFVSSNGQVNAVRSRSYGRKSIIDWSKQISASARVTNFRNRFTVKIRIPEKALGRIRKKEGFPINFMRSRVLKGKAPEYFVWGKLVRSFGDKENFGTLKVGTPMLKNGSFSQPLSHRNWKPHGTLDTGVFISAPSSVRLESGTKNAYIQQIMTTYKPNTRYRISFALKTENLKPRNKYAGACIKIQDKTGHQIWSPRILGTTDWIYYSREFTSAKDPQPNVGFVCWLYNCTGKAWFDDVVIEEIK